MKELWFRLKSSPLILGELLLASLFANLLALASPVFVIQVLNRYISSKVDATLITLTSGVVLAIALEFGFRQARLKLAETLNEKRNQDLMIGTFGACITAREEALECIPPGRRQEIVKGLESIIGAFGAPNLAALLDLPFAALFLAALAFLSPVIGLIALLFITLVLAMGFIHQHFLNRGMASFSAVSASGNELLATAHHAAATTRFFGGKKLLMEKWTAHVRSTLSLKQDIAGKRGRVQALTATAQALMSVSVYTAGALLVVNGAMDVGMLIGANILAARALAPVARFPELWSAMGKAKHALDEIYLLGRMDMEPDKGATPRQYTGGLKFKDLSFAYPDVPAPLFESLNLDLAPGAVLMVVGASGTGKTTLARLVTGLRCPGRGQILADGIDLQQLSMPWWRKQIIYLPQEPLFLPGTIRENLVAANPELDDDGLEHTLRSTGLKPFIDESGDGLNTLLLNNGKNLALGLRRRLALARALTADGNLALFDEPTDGMDITGKTVVLSVLKELSQQGKTLIINTDDPSLLRGATLILDLNQKPCPKIHKIQTPPVGEDGRVPS